MKDVKALTIDDLYRLCGVKREDPETKIPKEIGENTEPAPAIPKEIGED